MNHLVFRHSAKALSNGILSKRRKSKGRKGIKLMVGYIVRVFAFRLFEHALYLAFALLSFAAV